ncbi:hypothetical protein McpSp1_10260 [Methanocorpusculaceae archaeon Sp1]|nr:hypothetical protein [Methanocorpusculaceae archaeon Sp1]
MGKTEDKRFQIAWLSVILMLGIAVLVGYLGTGLLAAAGVFLLGTGLIMIALSLAVGKREPVITGGGALFAVIGAIFILLYSGADMLLVLGGALIGIALAAIVYVAAKK